MTHLWEYAVMICKVSREEFAAEHSHLFLLFSKKQLDGSEAVRDTVATPMAVFKRLAEEQGLLVSDSLAGIEVVPVARETGDNAAHPITVGRSVEADVLLPDSSISSKHGHFRYVADGRVFFEDLGSRNGTWLNDQRLEAGKLVEAPSGSELSFGNVRTSLLDAGALYDHVSGQLTASDSE